MKNQSQAKQTNTTHNLRALFILYWLDNLHTTAFYSIESEPTTQIIYCPVQHIYKCFSCDWNMKGHFEECPDKNELLEHAISDFIIYSPILSFTSSVFLPYFFLACYLIIASASIIFATHRTLIHKFILLSLLKTIKSNSWLSEAGRYFVSNHGIYL